MEKFQAHEKLLYEHITRIVVGLILFVLVTFCIYRGGVFLLSFLTLVSFVAIFEFCNILKERLCEQNLLLFIIVISLYLPFYYFIPLTAYETVLIFVLFLFIFSISFIKIEQGIYWVFFFSFTLLYIPFLLSFAIIFFRVL